MTDTSTSSPLLFPFDKQLVQTVLDGLKQHEYDTDQLMLLAAVYLGLALEDCGTPTEEDNLRLGILRMSAKLAGMGANGSYDEELEPMLELVAQVTKDVVVCSSAYEAAEGSHATILVTEWNEFRVLDLTRLKDAMAEPVFIDCRNVYNAQQMKEHGIRYDSFGRGSA